MQRNVFKPNKDLDPTQVKLLTHGYSIPFEKLSGGEKSLCTAIIVQAILDYQDCDKRGVDKVDRRDEQYSKSEIIRFFQSAWCRFLLKQLGGHYTGEQILKSMQRT